MPLNRVLSTTGGPIPFAREESLHGPDQDFGRCHDGIQEPKPLEYAEPAAEQDWVPELPPPWTLVPANPGPRRRPKAMRD